MAPILRRSRSGCLDWTDAPASTPFAALAETAAAVGATRSKNAKRDLLAAYLRGLPPGDLAAARSSSPVARSRARPRSSVSAGCSRARRSAASGADEEALRAAYLRHSDFGDAAAELLARAAFRPALTVSDVARAFAAIAAAGSGEQRIGLMTDLFARATTEEARFIGRIASRETRIGLREGLLEEASPRPSTPTWPRCDGRTC